MDLSDDLAVRCCADTVVLPCEYDVRTSPRPCDFVTGDGSGDSEELIGDAPSALACANMVMAQRHDANGATYSNTGGTGCYAEFGMTGAIDNDSWQTCMFDNPGGH